MMNISAQIQDVSRETGIDGRGDAFRCQLMIRRTGVDLGGVFLYIGAIGKKLTPSSALCGGNVVTHSLGNFRDRNGDSSIRLWCMFERQIFACRVCGTDCRGFGGMWINAGTKVS